MTRTPSTRPTTLETFRFACHKAQPCFTRCCADLDLVLTPYDILRLKNRLGLSSDVFLDRYTTGYTDRVSKLPLVRLNMQNDTERRCPLVTPQGCSVYSDRPGACRLYPLGQAISKMVQGYRSEPYYFKVQESHCLGWQAEKEWTIPEWLADQGLDEYMAMNAGYLEISTGQPLKVLKKLSDRHRQVYYTACYDLDGFRRLIFDSSFLQKFDISKNIIDSIRTDDNDLMAFAARWIKFSLFGQRTLPLGKARVD